MPITYDAVTNTIVGTGYSVGTPYAFLSMYNADKAGTRSVHARTGITAADGTNVAVDSVLTPTDYVVLGGANNDLYIIVSNYNGGGACQITVFGTDAGGTTQSEIITFAGDGTYQTGKYYKTVTHTRVSYFGSSGSFDYDLTQGQWGKVWRKNNEFTFDCHVDVGNGITTTWFADTNKAADYTGTGTFIKITSNATFRIGEAVNRAERTSKNGCFISAGGGVQNIIHMDGNCVLELYSSIVDSGGDFYMLNQAANSNKHCIWNSNWRGHAPMATNGIPDIDIYRVNVQNSVSGILSIGTQKDIHVGANSAYGAFLVNMPANEGIDGYKIDGVSYDMLISGSSNRTLYVDNSFSWHGDAWVHMWSGSANNPIYHRFDFELRTIDSTLTAIANAKYKIWDLVNVLVANKTGNDDGYLGLDGGAATSGSTTTLVDTSKSWTVDEFSKRVVTITSNTGAGQTRTIASNTATALTVTPDWTTNPTANSKYYISPIKLHHGYFPNTNTETMETPHTMRIYKYGKIMQYSKFRAEEPIDWLITLNNDPYITVTTEATVAAYTGIAVDYGTETITISENHTIEEIYDYLQHDIIDATAQLDHVMATADGINFVMAEDWDMVVNTGIAVAAAGKKLSFSGTGAWTLTGTADFTGVLTDGTNTRVRFAFELTPSITGYEWRIYTVTGAGSLVGAVEVAGEETATADNQTYIYTHTADITIAVQIIGHAANDYIESITYYTISDNNQSVDIVLTKDDNN